MALPEDTRYPLSDPKGSPIPYDVGEPQGLFIVDVALTVSATKNLPAAYETVVLWATCDCIVNFGGTAVTTRDADQANTQFVPANTPVSVKVSAAAITVIGISATGILFVQKYRRWDNLGTAVLQELL